MKIGPFEAYEVRISGSHVRTRRVRDCDRWGHTQSTVDIALGWAGALPIGTTIGIAARGKIVRYTVGRSAGLPSVTTAVA